MSDESSPEGREFPEVRNSVCIREESHVVEISTHYRGKTNMYVVERTSLLSILDKSGRELNAVWKEDWIEIAPGIDTRREDRVYRTRIGSHSSEQAIKGSVRIQRLACPVHIQFRHTLEYNDYDDSRFSSNDSSDYWIRYEG